MAWKTRTPAPSFFRETEIRAQYFEANGAPMGGEFRLNMDNTPTNGPGRHRRLARSGRHTIRYGFNGQVAAAWTAGDPNGGSILERSVVVTYYSPGHTDTVAAASPWCLKGDGTDRG